MSNYFYIYFFTFISLYAFIDSQEPTIVIAKKIKSKCDKNLFKIIIDVQFSNKSPEDIYSFYLDITSSKSLLFKCLINPKAKQIICITNLESQQTELNVEDYIVIPYPFPEVEGIIWEYNSFLSLIYRRIIKIQNYCGKYILKEKMSRNEFDNRWDLVTRVNKIYGGKCLLSDSKDNFYSFKMNLDIIGGNLKDRLQEHEDLNAEFNISLFQNITVPLSIGELKILDKYNPDDYKKNNYYRFAFCYPLEEINDENYLQEGGFDFNCNIPIIEHVIFNGPVKITTFSDNIYALISSDDFNVYKYKYISIYFGIKSSSDKNSNDDFNEDFEDNDKENITDYNNETYNDNILEDNEILNNTENENNELENQDILNNTENNNNESDLETFEIINIINNQTNIDNKIETNETINELSNEINSENETINNETINELNNGTIIDNEMEMNETLNETKNEFIIDIETIINEILNNIKNETNNNSQIDNNEIFEKIDNNNISSILDNEILNHLENESNSFSDLISENKENETKVDDNIENKEILNSELLIKTDNEVNNDSFIEKYIMTNNESNSNNNSDFESNENINKIDNFSNIDNDDLEEKKIINNIEKDENNDTFVEFYENITDANNNSNIRYNLRGLQQDLKEQIMKEEEPYLLLDDKINNFICPDKPVFEITNIQDGITYNPIGNEDDKLNLILTGYLKNGYKLSKNSISLLEYNPNEIEFNLTISNNLIEDSSYRKTNLLCTLGAGTFFSDVEKTNISCIGDKKDQKNKKNSDITVNWAYKENKYLDNIVIRWPKDLRIHSKKVYSYNINALSINKLDYDCYDNNFYFYINIFDLKSEPQISFNVQMELPNSINASCSLYTSSALKCYLDLRLRKIKKGDRIKLPDPGVYNILTNDGNYINFTIINFSDENNTEIADPGIIADESCGDNVVIGAIKDIGYSYGTAIGIVLGITIAFGLIIFIIIYCSIYQITHRNKKGKYFSHTEEKNNESSIQKLPGL